MEILKHSHLTKVTEGSLVWVDKGRNPQKYGDEIKGEIHSIIGMTTFTDPAYGIDSLLKVKYYPYLAGGVKKLRTGHVIEVIQY